MDGHGGGGSSRRSASGGKKAPDNGSGGVVGRTSITRSPILIGDRNLRGIRLSKSLTLAENSTVHEACRRMAVQRVDAVLLTDSNALLCGILTDKDITTRVVARELKLQETQVSKVMTRNPFFVLSDTLAVEALQKMVQGKFRHLPIVENGEVIGLLDIAKCLYDAIARMEREAEKGKAIAAAVQRMEKHWGSSFSGPATFIETLQEWIFRPRLSTIIQENSKFVRVSPTDSVLTATKKMLELKISSAVVTIENKLQGILTSRDILMRVIAKNVSPELTPVKKVMTPNPECGTIDTPIADALHTMHERKFLHLPVVDRDGDVVAVVDVIHIAHAAIAAVGSRTCGGIETASSMMQNFLDSALSLQPLYHDDDCQSEGSTQVTADTERSSAFYPPSDLSASFGFKLEDKQQRMHRFNCETHSLADLITCILQSVGDDIDRNHLPQILYEDEDHDKVILASDSDLVAAVDHARQSGWKSLRLHLDFSGLGHKKKGHGSGDLECADTDAWATAYRSVAAGAALIAGIGVMAYLKRSAS
ncbi:CBS domain-containing protein CBSCBSPB1 isoform X1 [Musa acuminata AAA Group]|uniref:CBS domain-containing protein CBSCBSPB1 isoform X1 n=1 Tax=Musa acuminata AAA Group TaxID=214697 RepID=UPI0031DEDD66